MVETVLCVGDACGIISTYQYHLPTFCDPGDAGRLHIVPSKRQRSRASLACRCHYEAQRLASRSRCLDVEIVDLRTDEAA